MRVLTRTAVVLLLLQGLLFAQAGEFRGMWVSRFEWPDRDPAKCRAKIDDIMQTLAAHNFNAVVFQVRGQCDTLYPSPEEPWSPILSPSGADPGWDPMAYAIEAARAHKLEFHAYINTHVAWQAARKQPPAAANHVYFKHFNDQDPAACDWVIHDQDGKPATWGSEYVWIAPGVPAAQAYIRRQVMHVVRNYDVDGVHFDRIRTPNEGVSHDPISVARMQPGAEGNPAGLEFAAWTADQFTRFLCDMYAEIAEVKPRIQVSSAPLGLVSRDRYPNYIAGYEYGLTKCHQDAQAWMAAGAMDWIAPQIYWADNDNKPPDFSDVLPDWVAHAAGRHVYPGLSVNVGIADLIRQVHVTRRAGGLGNVIFSYGSFKQKRGFGQYSRARGVYARPAAAPAMPWKDSPADGIILGTVTDARTGEPIVDAQVRREGSDYVALSSADGLYALLKVPPGDHTLTVSKSGMPDPIRASVNVAAGQVARVPIRMGEPPVVAVVTAQPRVEPASVQESRREPPQSAAPVTPTEPRATPAVQPEPVEAVAGEAEDEPLGADAAEAWEQGRATARQIETVVTAERPAFIRWVLLGLIVAGIVVGGIVAVVLFASRRESE